MAYLIDIRKIAQIEIEEAGGIKEAIEVCRRKVKDSYTAWGKNFWSEVLVELIKM